MFTDQAGQTPLDPEQIRGLKIKTIATQEQLNEFEQANINEALSWLTAKRKINNVLSEEFLIHLHQRMFGLVWNWAGQLRRMETKLGVDWINISVELRQLVADSIFWVEHNTYLPDEMSIRFKHRLVSIHCFPNGNGRHSRVMADLISQHVFGLKKFSWGQGSLVEPSAQRTAYLKALKLADKGDYTELMKFARS